MKALVLASALLLTACLEPESVKVDTDPGKITYSQDRRTDLCFASLGRKSMNTRGDVSWSFSITAVPCTERVLALIDKL